MEWLVGDRHRHRMKVILIVTGIVILLGVGAILALSFISAGRSKAEERQPDPTPNTVYKDANGNVVKNHWMLVNGKKYFLGEDGKIMTNHLFSYDEKQYYMGEDGAFVTDTTILLEDKLYDADDAGVLTPHAGWAEVGGAKYYGEKDGKLTRRWMITENGKNYYFDADGKMMTTGLLVYQGKMMKASSDGTLTPASGWQEFEGETYYGESDGTIAQQKELQKDGATVYVDENGKILKGDFYNYQDGLFFADESGKKRKQAGWFRWKKRWYYSDADGKFAQREYVEVDGKKYFMDITGARIVGKPTIDQYLQCNDIYGWMTSHHSDYYFKTNYISLANYSRTPELLIRPYGEYGEESGMNCTGFISSLVYYSGGDLDKVSAMGNYGGYGNGDNYLKLALRGLVEYDTFSSASAMLKSGKAAKGDILYLAPVWRSGRDCHMGVFWGDTPSENKLWSQTLKTHCTVTEIYMVDPVNQIFHYPIEKNHPNEYYEEDEP